MLKERTAILSDDDTNIRSVSSNANDDGTTATIDFVVETLDLRHFNMLTVDTRTSTRRKRSTTRLENLGAILPFTS